MSEINFDFHVLIEVVKGGFLLHYPVKNEVLGVLQYNQVREIFTSSRKMNQRIKEVLEAVSTTPVEGE